MSKVVIKELKQTNGNHRVTLSNSEVEKLEAKEGDYLKIQKLEEENEDP